MYDLYACGVCARLTHYNNEYHTGSGAQLARNTSTYTKKPALLYKGVSLNTRFDSHWNVGLEYRIGIT